MLLSVRFKPFAFLLSLGFLAGEKPATAAASTVEELMSAENTPAGIAITVETGGCTKKSDFKVDADQVQNGKAAVEFRRLTADTCKGNFPEGLKLEFTWADLKLPQGTELLVKNPVDRPASDGSPRKKADRTKPQKPSLRTASARRKSTARAKLARKHIRRRVYARAKVRASSHKRAYARVHAGVRAHRFCERFPHSRKCHRRMHSRTYRRHHRLHRHGAYYPFTGF